MREHTNDGIEISQNSILRISEKKTMQLIQLYKNDECLWNTWLDDYPNKSKRVSAAEKIARILNIKNFGGKHVMTKFKNLRNSYCQELKKIAQSLSTVDDSVEVYKPKVQWFPLMDSFIRPHLQTSRSTQPAVLAEPRKPQEIDIKMECYESDGQGNWAVHSQDNTLPELNEFRVDVVADSWGNDPGDSQSENEELSNDSRTKKRRLSTSSTPSEQNQTQVSLHNQSSRCEDTFDNFGKYIASLLRSLSPEKALRLQPRIVNMIVEVGVQRGGVDIDRLGDSETD